MPEQMILVVDAERTFLQFSRQRLAAEGFAVTTAHKGIEALPQLRQHAFDLVLLAHQLPDLDSPRLVQHIQKQLPDAALVVTIPQGNVAVSLVTTLSGLGAQRFLQKPCTGEALLGAVYQALPRPEPDTVRGSLRACTLPNQITMHCNEGVRAFLEINHQGEQAHVYFDHGEVVHATLGTLQGRDALFRALSWGEGQFVLRLGVAAPERTIHSNWMNLLLDGMRKLDESAFDQEGMETEPMSPLTAPEEDGGVWEEPVHAPEPAPSPEAAFTPPAGPAAPRQRAPQLEIDPQTQEEIEGLLTGLYNQLRPRCLLFARRSGRLIYLQGETGPEASLSLAALIAGSFSASAEIASLIAREMEVAEFRQSLQEGEDFNLHSSQVEPGAVLAVAFGQRTQLGMARLLIKRAVDELETMLAQASVTTESRQVLADKLDDSFRQQVGDALGDLFG